MAKNRGRAISAPAIPHEPRPLKFSLKYLDSAHTKFPLSKCKGDFFDHLITALHRYSCGSVDDFTDMRNDDYRHSFDFSVTTEPDGFAHLDEELRGALPWQFAVCPDSHTPPHS